jgi:hypothetical protein
MEGKELSACYSCCVLDYMGQRGHKYSNNSKATRTIQYAVNSLNTSQKQVSITN